MRINKGPAGQDWEGGRLLAHAAAWRAPPGRWQRTAHKTEETRGHEGRKGSLEFLTSHKPCRTIATMFDQLNCLKQHLCRTCCLWFSGARRQKLGGHKATLMIERGSH